MSRNAFSTLSVPFEVISREMHKQDSTITKRAKKFILETQGQEKPLQRSLDQDWKKANETMDVVIRGANNSFENQYKTLSRGALALAATVSR